MSAAELLAEAIKLPIDERIELVQAIWDSISENELPGLTSAQEQELDRRLADDDANPDDGIPWEAVRAEAEARTKAQQ